MKGLLVKFLSFSYGSWVGLFIGLLSTAITTRLLTPGDFGKSSMFILAINVLMILVIFGTDQSYGRFFYEEEEKKRGGLLYNCLKLPILNFVLITLIIFLFNNKITFFLFGETSIILTIALAIGILVQFLYRYSKLVIRMQQKGNLYSRLEILNKILNLLILVLLFFLWGPSYKIIIFSTIFTLILVTLVAIYYGRNHWNLRSLLHKNLTHKSSEIIKFGSPFVVTLSITWLFQSFDKIALRQWGSFEELGLYSAAARIVTLVAVIQTTFSTFWTPVSYEKFQKEPENKNFFSNISKLVSFCIFLVAILSIAGKDLIVILLGSEYTEAAKIMPFLVFMPILYTISETTVIGINFYKKSKWHILIAGTACFINILGNWLLVPHYGSVGASISTAFSYVVFFAMRTVISQWFYKVNYELKKVYSMIVITSVYATFSIINNNFFYNLFTGIVALLVLILIYRKDLYILINQTRKYNK
ncbi:oligosaccharide flippase family protein [Bacillus haikouensis]|nr:oligosaccharide flippase family protein [Bacillus haikouensis]